MSIYTKTGDKGSSSIIGEGRIPKNSPVFDTLGSLDELNALLGFLQKCRIKEIKSIILEIQSDLFEIGASIATIKGKSPKFSYLLARISFLEASIDKFDALIPPLENFILPGGTETSSRLHQSRAVCRRVERNLVSFVAQEDIMSNEDSTSDLLAYINRLSDLLFVLARYANHKTGVKDQIWKPKNV